MNISNCLCKIDTKHNFHKVYALLHCLEQFHESLGRALTGHCSLWNGSTNVSTWVLKLGLSVRDCNRGPMWRGSLMHSLMHCREIKELVFSIFDE
jgi:hypothetical protein